MLHVARCFLVYDCKKTVLNGQNSFSHSFLTTISELTLDHRQELRLNVQKKNSLDTQTVCVIILFSNCQRWSEERMKY
ncbi:hypothetical protein MHYP_G00300580 [Metynnis hypsauchen]